MIKFVEELFYFYPENFGYIPSSIDTVHLVGEFNQWGKDIKKLDSFNLTMDKTGRWIGLFKVPAGRSLYKFILNRNTLCPDMGHLCYSTSSSPEWAKKAVWYQIMVDRFFNGNSSIHTPNLISWDSPPDYFNNFGGDLAGIKEKIPYLKNLFGCEAGVEKSCDQQAAQAFRNSFYSLENKALYLNPIQKSTASNHKYWPEDFDAIDPQFGNDEDLKSLIDELHFHGAKIILDLVYNHTGINHHAFLDILKNGRKSRYFNWYRDLPNLLHDKIEIPVLEDYLENCPRNIFIENDPRDNDFNPEKESFINVWQGKYRFPVTNPEKFTNSSIEDILNNQPYYRLVHTNNGANYMCWCRNFEMPELNTKDPTLKKHLYTAARKWVKLGVDGFRLDVPDLLTDAQEFWQEFRKNIREEFTLNNRNPDDAYIVGEIWNSSHAESFILGDKNGKASRFDAIMNYPVREAMLDFLSGEILNRGTDSVMSIGEISPTDLDKTIHKNLSYVSWETVQSQYNLLSSHDTRRLRTILKDDRKLKAALVMQFTMPGAPAVYYGEELGMQGNRDPANRASMKWDIFNDLLHHKTEYEIFEFYKKLIDLREKYSCFVSAPLLTLITDDSNKIYAYTRYKETGNCAITLISKNKIDKEINIVISGTPLENIENWKNPLTDKTYVNYGKNIIIKPEDFSDCFGIVLIPFD